MPAGPWEPVVPVGPCLQKDELVQCSYELLHCSHQVNVGL